MKTHKSKNAVIFIRTTDETKEEFLKAAEKELRTASSLGEYLIRAGSKKILSE